MSTTIDQTGRPAGHPGYCSCDGCAAWLTNAGAAPPRRANTWAAPEPKTVSADERTADYARRIHWWVRLFGVVWLATILIGVIGAVSVAVMAASESAAPSDYEACVDRGVSISTCLELYGYDN
jgi:hypothetical protein